MPADRMQPSRGAQHGAALIASLLFVVLIGLGAFLAFSRSDAAEAERQRKTEQALAEAKAALLGYAVARPLEAGEPNRRLGELPCPDVDGDGDADLNCASPASRLGRLPWRTLGLPDLRDGDGERLWYAVSDIHKMNPRTNCSLPENSGCLNSDAQGSITVRDAGGSIVHNAEPQNPPTYGGAIAVVIAPGAILTRQDGTVQVRSTPTATSQPVNYLDVVHGEDNANFADYATNGFIAGPVRNAGSGEIASNDRIAVLTYEDLMPALERRVAREVGRCLDAYAAANQGRYPWAADTNTSAIAPVTTLGGDIVTRVYADTTDRLIGRIPDTLANTQTTGGGSMAANWPAAPACNIASNTRWWIHWKLRVFYAVANWYRPGTGTPTLPCEECLTVLKPDGNQVDVRYFVAVAGRRLSAQNRTTDLGILPETLSNPANFLELENAAMFSKPGQTTARAGPASATFNDVTVFRF